MQSPVLRRFRVASFAELAAAATMLLSYPLLVTAALLPHAVFFAAVCAVSYLADSQLHRLGSPLVGQLSKVRAGLSLRFLVRQLTLVLLLSRMELADDPLTFTAIAAFILFYGLQAPQSALTTVLRRRRRLPVITRNIDLSALRIADAPPAPLTRRAAEKMLHLDLPAVAGVLASAQTGRTAYGFAGMAVTLALAVLYTAVLTGCLRKGKLPPDTDAVLEWWDGWLRAYRPTTVLYFSGSAQSTYQVNMWLRTLEQLDGRPLVILRERHTLTDLGATSVPVACVPSAVHLMNSDLSMVRVALYPANVGKNIHLLRVPTMKHVFIGHGDSDKIASVNPYSKVYDEVWTAGKAGRDRYALAGVGVRDEDIVEVGRPQLAPIRPPRQLPPDTIPTVLYAPTWEGWTDEPGNTSLILAGENIVRRLITSERPVRVLYKPHPFTGTRSPEAAAAHARITALVEEAARQRAAEPEWARRAAREEAAQAAARAELARVDARLACLSATSGQGADEAQTARDALADPAREAEITALRAEWNTHYWRSFGWWEHRVITGSWPALYDCFNESDGMVSDISSVVSDFIASGKPYAVTDSAGLGVVEFKRQNTAVRAAVVLSNDAAELGVLPGAIADPSADPLATARAELKSYLLGPDEPPSIERFNTAVRALGAKAEVRNLERVG
ncbi:hypothetical protein DVA86_09465 [Streptomyces armeniacus]|uniref:Integral membrane protein n=2 Tax=Streptomyces armeniacus TaxID=83291 RepID=A0A345XZZ7_9ACTN|nr:hypothetical protein [Streptomyces armeniacus]AXK37213.1 hypothetical protein DVA86_09465 [Streptomyces armeniacus]